MPTRPLSGGGAAVGLPLRGSSLARPDMRLPQLALIVLLGLALVQSWVAYPEMPERMASHFGPGGQADGYSGKGTFFALFALLEVLIVAMFLGLPRLVGLLPPSLVNLPNRDYWLAPERVGQAQRLIARQMSGMGLATLLFLILVKHSVIVANTTAEAAGAGLDGVFAWALGAYLLYTVVWVFGFLRAFRVPEEASV